MGIFSDKVLHKNQSLAPDRNTLSGVRHDIHYATRTTPRLTVCQTQCCMIQPTGCRDALLDSDQTGRSN